MQAGESSIVRQSRSKLREGGEHSGPSACTVLTRDFEDAFGESATTVGLLLRRRYVLPSQSRFVSIFVAKCPSQAEKVSMQSKKNSNHQKKLPSARKTVNNPSGSFRGPKKVFGVRCDASKNIEKHIAKMSLSLCS
jgi:hypothetical protein